MHKTSSASSLGVGGPGGLDLSQAFFRPIHNTAPPSSANRHTKITVVGAGEFGKAIAQAILTQYLVHEIAIIDASSEELRGAKFDLEHAAAFLPCTTILSFSSDYAVTSGSDLIVITAGDRKNTGESKLNLIQKNVALFKSIIPELAKHSPDAILMVVSQPVDILTYVAWKLSGFPPNRVIGSGTNMASSRFRFLLADHLDVNAQDVQAYIVGEHGDRSFVLKSSLSVRGEPILRFMERQQIANDEKMLESIFMGMDEDTSSFRFSKHHASWAIGYSVASLAWTILRDQLTIHPVSVHTKGFHGIDGGDVFLSLPAQLGRGGVVGTTKVEMTDEDVQRLKASAETLLSLQSQLGGMAESCYKQKHDLEERRAEAARLREKYPDRIPVIVEKAERSDIPNIDKKTYIVHADPTVGQSTSGICKKIKLSKEGAYGVIVEKAERSDVPNIDKKMYIVPDHLTVEQFASAIRQKIKLSTEEAIFIFVDNVLLLPPTGAIMSAIYRERKDEDGFLYVTYRGETHAWA